MPKKRKEDNPRALDTASDHFAQIDLRPRESEIIDHIQAQGFIGRDVIFRSPYAHGGIGAFHVKGIFDGQPAVAKVQGAKPLVSEVDMISSFAAQNRSSLLRPPAVYHHLPWNQSRGYELIFMESIDGDFIIREGELAAPAQVVRFFEIYRDYQANCLTSPWLPAPPASDYPHRCQQWDKMLKAHPRRHLVESVDLDLISRASNTLINRFSRVSREFQQRHLSVNDLKRDGQGKIVIFSNLFWGYSEPLFDLTFAYSWYLLTIAHHPLSEIQDQQSLWQSEMLKVAREMGRVEDYRFALLERTAAQLRLDMLMVPQESDIVKLRPLLRSQLSALTSALSS